MELTDQMKEIIYYMFDYVKTESDKSFSVNFYQDNVEVSMYPMGDMVDKAGAADRV